MKKLIVALLGFLLFTTNVNALDQMFKSSNYFVSINKKIINMKKLEERKLDKVYFNLTREYLYSNAFNKIDNIKSIDEEKMNNIIKTIEKVYIKNKDKEFYYYLAQVIIYKYLYSELDVYMCDSTGNGRIYEELINKLQKDVEELIYPDPIQNKDIMINEKLILSDNYDYLIESKNIIRNNNMLSFKEPNIYDIKYRTIGLKELYSYEDYYIIGSDSKSNSDYKTLKVNVNGLCDEYIDAIENKVEINIPLEQDIVENPKTGDSILISFILILSSTFMLIISKKVLKS